jgi:2,3-bisphosphoglycerate-independent phosphoglycerate mutase
VRKGVILIIDGLGDSPVAVLDNRTPLEAADTPNMNGLAGRGVFGLVDPIHEGVVPNTHSGAGTLMGLSSTSIDLLSRGPVEAAGSGYSLEHGDVAFRVNLATFEGPDQQCRDRRAGRIDRDSQTLLSGLSHVELSDGTVASLNPTDQHRAVLILSGKGLSPEISDTDPGMDSIQAGGPVQPKPCVALDVNNSAAVHTARIAREFIKRANGHLAGHSLNEERRRNGKLPANGILLRGAGSIHTVESRLRGLGISTAVVAGCNTVLGLGRLSGFHTVTLPSFTATLDTDLNAKIGATLQALQNHDLVYIHVKAPDICAHDRNPQAKRAMLERIDDALKPLCAADLVIGVCADHSTDSNTGLHTNSPVPGLMCDTGLDRNSDVIDFGERQCVSGPLGRINSSQFLERLLHRMGYPSAANQP